MKKIGVCSVIAVALFLLSMKLSSMGQSTTPETDSIPAAGAATRPVYIPESPQRSGDPALGYTYVVEGDYLRSGIPYDLFILGYGKDRAHYLKRDSANREIPYNFTAVKAYNGLTVVVPNCLQCHAQVFGDSLIVGLGR